MCGQTTFKTPVPRGWIKILMVLETLHYGQFNILPWPSDVSLVCTWEIKKTLNCHFAFCMNEIENWV